MFGRKSKKNNDATAKIRMMLKDTCEKMHYAMLNYSREEYERLYDQYYQITELYRSQGFGYIVDEVEEEVLIEYAERTSSSILKQHCKTLKMVFGR